MQVFSNNALTTLAAELAIDATSMTVTASTGFAALTAPQFELVTLEAPNATREIVKVTARSGNTWTIARAQEVTTAALWAAGSKVEARATAGTLAGMAQRDVSSVALGTAAIAAGTDAVSIGANADATQAEAVAVGSLAQATGGQGVAIGKAAAASNGQAIAQGVFASASGAGAIAIGWESKGRNTGAVAVGSYADAAGGDSVAVGASSIADSDGSALGKSAKAGGRGLAIGMGSCARGYHSAAINGAQAFAGDALYTYGFQAIPNDDWNDQWEVNSAGSLAAFATPYVDLGAAPDWHASQTIGHGDIVKPTAGGTVQYRAWCQTVDATWIHETADSGTTEPTWPGAGGAVFIGATTNRWVGIDWGAGYETTTFPDWLTFHPVEILFVCQSYAATTGTPTISIGAPSAPTAILNAAQVPITAAGQTYRFTLPNPCPGIDEGGSLLITLDSAASAGTMLGRFLIAGYFVETKSRA